VVAAAVADAPAPVTPAQQEGQTPAVGRFEAAGLRKSGTPAAPAPAGRFEAAGLRQMGSATSAPAAPEAVQEQQKQQEAAVEQQQKQEVVALAAEEMEANLEAMSNEVGSRTVSWMSHLTFMSLPLTPPCQVSSDCQAVARQEQRNRLAGLPVGASAQTRSSESRQTDGIPASVLWGQCPVSSQART
jgi:hypothetical protein